MLSMNLVLLSIVLCFVVADVELYPGSFRSSFSSGLFPTTQDEEEVWEEERDTEAEDRIITKLAQIIREIKLKYAPKPPTQPPPVPNPAFVPDFTYHFPQKDLSALEYASVPFAVRPNDNLFYQPDFSSHIKPRPQAQDEPPVQKFYQDDYEPHSYHPIRESNPRTPRPQYMRPMMILVKDDIDGIDVGTNKKKDEAQEAPQSNYHKGHPKWTATQKEALAGEPLHHGDTQVFITKDEGYDDDNMYFIALVTGCSAALLLVIAVGSYSWYKLQRNSKLGADVKYPAYSVGGVAKNGAPPNSGDRRLAHSAQMYHYQHQKQQILALENNTRDQRRGSVSDVDSDDENDADHTVYECPTLPMTNKKTPDIEVKKPTVEKKPTPSLPSSNTSEDSQNLNQGE